MLTTSSNSLTAANQLKPFHEGAKGVNLPVCIKISKTIFPSIWRTRSHCDRGAEPWDKACAIFSSSSQTRTEVGFLLPYLPIAFYIFTLFCCLNPLIWLTSLLVVCSAKLQTGRTHKCAYNISRYIITFRTQLFLENRLHSFACLCDAKAAGIAHRSARSCRVRTRNQQFWLFHAVSPERETIACFIVPMCRQSSSGSRELHRF